VNYLSNTIYKNILNDVVNNLTRSYSCLSNYDNQFETLFKCKKAIYSETDDEYQCISCIAGYSINKITKKCELTKEINCEIEYIDIDSKPKESCKKCYNNYDILVETESGVKICETPYNPFIPELNNPNTTVPELEGCTAANVSTKYYYNEYYCTKCSYSYVPYYSSFFKTKICQYIYSDPITEKEFDSIFDTYENFTINNVCPKNLFNPGNGKCFECSDKKVGMIGCSGHCTFSKNRINVLQCEEKCKDGYIDTKKGVCESCN
jgi:hypothetical protein